MVNGVGGSNYDYSAGQTQSPAQAALNDWLNGSSTTQGLTSVLNDQYNLLNEQKTKLENLLPSASPQDQAHIKQCINDINLWIFKFNPDTTATMTDPNNASVTMHPISYDIQQIVSNASDPSTAANDILFGGSVNLPQGGSLQFNDGVSGLPIYGKIYLDAAAESTNPTIKAALNEVGYEVGGGPTDSSGNSNPPGIVGNIINWAENNSPSSLFPS